MLIATNTNEKLIKAAKKNGVLIAAHRGTCGGNIIQNTCIAYENSLQHGADMIEVDVVMSTDGDFFAFHNGKEPLVLGIQKDIRQMTTKEIEECRCLNFNQINEKGNQKLERLETILKRFKDRCFINIDRSWFYWKEIIKFLDKQNMQSQILLKSPVEENLLKTLKESNSDLMYMPIVKTIEDWELVRTYDINMVAVELIFENLESPFLKPEFINSLHKKGILVWVNSIMLNDEIVLSGLLDDNHAITDGYDEIWGRLIKFGFDIIQTDWPALLKKYVASKTENI